MATDDAMDVESATQGLYMDVEQQVPNQNLSGGEARPVGSSTTFPNPTTSLTDVPSASPREISESILAARRGVVNFLKRSKAEDIIPDTSRVALVDSSITLKQAFRALVQNGVKAAPIINMSKQELRGVLSVSDILDALLRVHDGLPLEMGHELSEGLDSYTVHTWHVEQHQKRIRNDDIRHESFQYALAEDSLFDAVRIMRDRKVLYLPVLSQDHRPLHTLEHWRIMRFVHRHFTSKNKPRDAAMNTAVSDSTRATGLFAMTLSQLGVGTFRNLVTISPSTRLLQALKVLRQHDLFAVPVVNGHNQLIEVYSRADAALLATGRYDSNTLQQTVMDVLRSVRCGMPFVGVTCGREELLGTVFERFERTGVQRMYVIGQSGVEGVVSLVTFLRFFLQGF